MASNPPDKPETQSAASSQSTDTNSERSDSQFAQQGVRTTSADSRFESVDSEIQPSERHAPSKSTRRRRTQRRNFSFSKTTQLPPPPLSNQAILKKCSETSLADTISKLEAETSVTANPTISIQETTSEPPPASSSTSLPPIDPSKKSATASSASEKASDSSENSFLTARTSISDNPIATVPTTTTPIPMERSRYPDKLSRGNADSRIRSANSQNASSGLVRSSSTPSRTKSLSTSRTPAPLPSFPGSNSSRDRRTHSSQSESSRTSNDSQGSSSRQLRRAQAFRALQSGRGASRRDAATDRTSLTNRTSREPNSNRQKSFDRNAVSTPNSTTVYPSSPTLAPTSPYASATILDAVRLESSTFEAHTRNGASVLQATTRTLSGISTKYVKRDMPLLYEIARYVLYILDFVFGILMWGVTVDRIMPQVFPGTGVCLFLAAPSIDTQNSEEGILSQLVNAATENSHTCAAIVAAGVVMTGLLIMIVIWHSLRYFGRKGMPYVLESVLLCLMSIAWFAFAVIVELRVRGLTGDLDEVVAANVDNESFTNVTGAGVSGLVDGIDVFGAMLRAVRVAVAGGSLAGVTHSVGSGIAIAEWCMAWRNFDGNHAESESMSKLERADSTLSFEV